MRVKKTRGSTTTYTFFAQYEEEVTNGVTTAISYYTFGGLRVAVKRGNTLYHLHGDHLGSTSLTTRGSSTTASRAYYAYGAERSATGDLRTDHTFTGQKRDATGLMYYNARYYDPALGTFVSPDTLVPNPARVIDYNRFLYARGNPLKYTDPTGNNSALGPAWVQEFTDRHGRAPNHRDRFDRLVSLVISGSGPKGSWTDRDWKQNASNPVLTPAEVRKIVNIDTSSWKSDPTESAYLGLLTEGVLQFGEKIGVLVRGGPEKGPEQLRKLIGGGVTWYRAAEGSGLFCSRGDACALESRRIGFYDGLFGQGKLTQAEHETLIRATAVHELAHKIHLAKACPPDHKQTCISRWFPDPNVKLRDWLDPNLVTGASWSYWENWAEGVAVWTFADYKPRPDWNTRKINLTDEQKKDIVGILGR